MVWFYKVLFFLAFFQFFAQDALGFGSYEKWVKQCGLCQKKKQFFRNILFCLWKENTRILRARGYVYFLNLKQKRHVPLTVTEKDYLKALFHRYGVHSICALLEQMDVIPASLALAQAITESGWGESPHARNRHAYFGMIKGGRCLSFDSPQHCVVAYIHNLNKHRAYKPMRQIRQRLRQKKKYPQGICLLPGLSSYCASGSYLMKIKHVIKKYHLDKLDCHYFDFYGAQ